MALNSYDKAFIPSFSRSNGVYNIHVSNRTRRQTDKSARSSDSLFFNNHVSTVLITYRR